MSGNLYFWMWLIALVGWGMSCWTVRSLKRTTDLLIDQNTRLLHRVSTGEWLPEGPLPSGRTMK